MKNTVAFLAQFSIFIFVAIIAGPAGLSADEDPKAAVLAAAQRLAQQPSFSWQTTVQGGGGQARGFRAPGFVGGEAATGQSERDGYTSVSQPGLQFVTKGGKAAILYEDLWMTLEQAAARSDAGGQRGPGQLNAAAVSGYKLPAARAAELVSQATDFKRDGDAITAALPAETVSDLLSGGAGGGF